MIVKPTVKTDTLDTLHSAFCKGFALTRKFVCRTFTAINLAFHILFQLSHDIMKIFAFTIWKTFILLKPKPQCYMENAHTAGFECS